MAFAFDAANTGVTENDTNAQTTFSITIGSGADRLFVLWAAWSTTTTTISNANIGGTTLVRADGQAVNRGTDIWYCYDPPSGAQTVTINYSANAGRVCAGGHSWTGANSSQTPQTVTASGTSAAPGGTCGTGTDELIIDCVGISFTAGETISVDADQTERGNITGGATRGASSSQLGSAGGVMSWTNSASKAWGYVAASFDAAAAAGDAVPVAWAQYRQRRVT